MAEYMARDLFLKNVKHNAPFIYSIVAPIALITPAADVAPVLHGRWLSWEEQFPDKKPRRKNNLGVFCNKCTKHADNRTDYCPNCGARMNDA